MDVRSLRKNGMPDGIADLYRTDLQMDGCSAVAEERDDLAAILDLYETDRDVDGAKRSAMRTTQEEMHMSLWKMDQFIDHKKSEDDVAFMDPITVRFLQQHKRISDSMVHRSTKIDAEILDLLCTDMEVNSCKIQTELMATVDPLLQVDQTIDDEARKKKFRDDFTHVRDLFIIDQAAEHAQHVTKNGVSRTQSETSIDALLVPSEQQQVVPEQRIQRSVSRSIFSVKEKDNARRHSVVGGAMDPGILQALLLNGGELDADISDREVKLKHSVVVPIRSMQDVHMTQESLGRSSSNEQNEIISERSTPENVVIQQKSFRRNIFSAKEKLSARQKGHHWL